MARVLTGRPRSYEADRRILDAALVVYGEAGWSGFNLSKVSKLAGVGKSSMYARWSEREDLLLDAFRSLVPTQELEGDSARALLIHEVESRMRLYLGTYAKALRRVFVEVSGSEPVIEEVHTIVFVEPLVELRRKLWGFKLDGLLPSNMSITRLLDAIEGSTLMRAFCLPPIDAECFIGHVDDYAESLVDDQLSRVQQRRLAPVRAAS